MRSMASVLNLKSKYLDFSVHRELFGVRGCGLVLTFLGDRLDQGWSATKVGYTTLFRR
jgi:hypothetical protein